MDKEHYKQQEYPNLLQDQESYEFWLDRKSI